MKSAELPLDEGPFPDRQLVSTDGAEKLKGVPDDALGFIKHKDHATGDVVYEPLTAKRARAKLAAIQEKQAREEKGGTPSTSSSKVTNRDQFRTNYAAIFGAPSSN